MAILAVVFAVSDAQANEGITYPTFSDIGSVTVATLALAGLAMLGIRRAEYAGEGFGPKVQRWLADVLSGLGHLLLVAAWLLSIGMGLEAAWAGVGLVAYAAVMSVWGTHLGLRLDISRWVARISGGVGLGMALVDPIPTIVAWTAVASLGVTSELVPAVGGRVKAIIGFGEHRLARLALIVIPVGVVISAVARLVPVVAASWVVLGAAALLAACRFLPGGVLPLAAGLPAALAVLTAIGLETARTIDLASGPNDVGTVPLGILLMAAAAIGAVIRLPAVVRFPFVCVAAITGATLVLRELVTNPVVADAGVAALSGTALCIAAVVRHRSDWAALADALGHLAAYVSVGVATAGDSRTALIFGLGAIVAVHGLGAGSADRGRSPLGFSGAGATANVILQGVVAAAVVPILAVQSADAFTWVRMEGPRAGLVLAALAWIYVIGLGFIRTTPLRRVMTVGAYALAAAGIAVTATSLTASVMAVWSATAVTALVAVSERSPARSMPAWLLGAISVVLTAAWADTLKGDWWDRLISWAGVAQRDLHFVVFGVALLMAILPVVIGYRDRLASRWLHPPLALGLLLMPSGIGFAIADMRFLAVLALTAAGVYVLAGILLRFGGFSLPAVLMIGIAYADLVEEFWVNPFEHPLAWMPLAAAFAIGGMLLPGRSFVRGDPGFGLVVGWWAAAGLAIILGFGEGQLDWIFLVDAVLLSGYGLAARSVPFWYGGLILYAVAGSLFGAGWLSLALAGGAAAVGAHAGLRNDRIGAVALVPLSLGLAVASFVMLGYWQQWTAGETMGFGLIAAAGLGATAGGAYLLRLPSRARMWVAPSQVTAQMGLVMLALMAFIRMAGTDVGWSWTGLSPVEARLAVAAVLGFEAALVGTVGTVKRWQEACWVSAGLAAGAVGMLLAWFGCWSRF